LIKPKKLRRTLRVRLSFLGFKKAQTKTPEDELRRNSSSGVLV
jgi:hypothetical protein